MSHVTVRLPRMLAQFTGGETSIAVDAVTTGGALEAAIDRHAMLRSHLMTEAGAVREHLHIFLNEDDVRDALETPARDGDEVYVLQAMSGGR